MARGRRPMLALVLMVFAACRNSVAPQKAEQEQAVAKSEPEPSRATDPAPRFVGLPAAATPGRAVIVDYRAESDKPVMLASLDGTSVPYPEGTPLYAQPYDRGRKLLLGVGSGTFEHATVGGTSTRNPYHYDDTLIAVGDAGHAGLFVGSDSDREVPTVQLWSFDDGSGAGLPTSAIDRCPTSGGESLSPNEGEALVACAPCRCLADPKGCVASLCLLVSATHVVREVYSARASVGSPVYAPDGRVLLAVGHLDTRMACITDPTKCRIDAAWLPAGDWTAEPTLLRRGAYPVAVSRVSGDVLLMATDDPDASCEAPPFAGWRLVVVDAAGRNARRIGESVTGDTVGVPTRPFSLDDAWILFTAWKGEESHARACRIDGGECRELGNGIATGWLLDGQPAP